MKDIHIKIGKIILKDFFEYNDKEPFDDSEYIPLNKLLINGIAKSISAEGFKEDTVLLVKDELKDFVRDLYINLWLKNATEDEGRDDIDLEEERNRAIYTFDYIYEHEEHPK